MRVGPLGAERPAVLVSKGGSDIILDLSELIGDVTPNTINRVSLDRIAEAIEGGLLPVLSEGQRIGAPIVGIGKIVCVGLNYRAHAAESSMPIPDEPILFMKAPDTVVGAFDQVKIPRNSLKTDYEVELAVVIGRTAKYLESSDNPLDYVAGYAISNDVSEREFQLERGGQWDKGKNCETFNPLGPWLVTTDEIRDPQKLKLSTWVNGELRQNSSTSDMIFSVSEIISYVSQFMTLYPGDIINTGTPQGVAAGMVPPKYLNDGDVVEIAIEGLGHQSQRFISGVTN